MIFREFYERRFDFGMNFPPGVIRFFKKGGDFGGALGQ